MPQAAFRILHCLEPRASAPSAMGLSPIHSSACCTHVFDPFVPFSLIAAEGSCYKVYSTNCAVLKLPY